MKVAKGTMSLVMALLPNDEFVGVWAGRQDRVWFVDQFEMTSRQEAVNRNSTRLQTKDREAVVSSLPVSMHAGQIFLLTKLLTATDLHFYEFETGAPVERWRSGSSGSFYAPGSDS